jgi:glucosamine kinase
MNKLCAESGLSSVGVECTRIVVVELGRAECRVQAFVDEAVVAEGAAPGVASLTELDGEQDAFRAVQRAFDLLPMMIRTQTTGVGVSLVGATGDRSVTRSLGRRLSRHLRVSVVVVNRAMAAHVGAFRGRPGVVLMAGTGAAAFGVTADGVLRRADGWGLWLGDEGGGRWIGQEGLRCALRAADGRGPRTSLVAPARAMLAQSPGLVRWKGKSAEPIRQLASFATTVFEHAAAGDSRSQAIVSEAARQLATTAACVQMSGDNVAVVGSLAENVYFALAVTKALTARGLKHIVPSGDSSHGLRTIAAHSNLPVEPHVIREDPRVRP